ncbi:hypothetical protein [Candidatus Leptofilum sp.]|uniref:hypothetical protein n=1 Tax=Candidatus Leptofilum sp. TaxID=3241576 RepID=UPI003B5C63DA
MTEYKLQQKEKISARNSKELILLLAKYGSHHLDGPSKFRAKSFPYKTDADVKRAYAQAGYEFNEVIKLCRNYENSVPLFENQVGSTFKTIGSPKISTVDMATGDESTILTSPGSYAIYEYWARFEKAAKSRTRAIRNTSFAELSSKVLQALKATLLTK